MKKVYFLNLFLILLHCPFTGSGNVNLDSFKLDRCTINSNNQIYDICLSDDMTYFVHQLNVIEVESMKLSASTTGLSNEELKSIQMSSDYQKAQRALESGSFFVSYLMFVFGYLFLISLPCSGLFVFYDALKRGLNTSDALLWSIKTMVFIFYFLPQWFWTRPNFAVVKNDLCPSCLEIYKGSLQICPFCGFNLKEDVIEKIKKEEQIAEEVNKLLLYKKDENEKDDFEDELWKATLGE